jgi:hypothetical protein
MSAVCWREIVRIAFKGERFRDHALDISALGELTNFQQIIAETAKAMWRDSNPDRERVPAHFEDRTRLCLRSIEPGSVIVPIEVCVEMESQPELFEPEPVEALRAVDLAGEVYRALAQDAPLPSGFPRSLIPIYQRWGEGLEPDEEMQLLKHGKAIASVTAASGARLAAYTESAYEDQVDLVGEVLEADLRLQKFQLWLDARTNVPVAFSPDQEERVTSALRDHRQVKLRVVGRGEFSAQGTPVRVHKVAELILQTPGLEFDADARSIEDIIAQLASEVPDKEWDRLPRDLSSNLDHYLYGGH